MLANKASVRLTHPSLSRFGHRRRIVADCYLLPMASAHRDEIVDVALDAATPILGMLEKVLDLVPVPGLGLIPKALSVLVDAVKVSRSPCSDKQHIYFLGFIRV